MPLASWGLAVGMRGPGTFANRFFAGFCLIANGAYIALGSFGAIGDCGTMLRHGSPVWSLWLFGAITMPVGLWLWHRQGEHFGLGATKGQVSRDAAYRCLAAGIFLVVIALSLGDE